MKKSTYKTIIERNQNTMEKYAIFIDQKTQYIKISILAIFIRLNITPVKIQTGVCV